MGAQELQGGVEVGAHPPHLPAKHFVRFDEVGYQDDPHSGRLRCRDSCWGILQDYASSGGDT